MLSNLLVLFLQAALQLAAEAPVAGLRAHCEAGKLYVQNPSKSYFAAQSFLLPYVLQRFRSTAACFIFFVTSSGLLFCAVHGITLVLSVSHQARLTHKRRKNIFHCLINIAWKMSLFVMWPLRVIWMRLIFHPGLQSSLFSQPLSYH